MRKKRLEMQHQHSEASRTQLLLSAAKSVFRHGSAKSSSSSWAKTKGKKKQPTKKEEKGNSVCLGFRDFFSKVALLLLPAQNHAIQNTSRCVELVVRQQKGTKYFSNKQKKSLFAVGCKEFYSKKSLSRYVFANIYHFL